MSDLPIEAQIPAIRDTFAEGRGLVLQAPPGAGKTTRVPLALLEAPWLAGQAIVMLEPRRLAARAAAARMAQMLGEAVGETVGYQVRFDRRVGPRTRIEVVTEGILTRRLQQDPTLEGVGLVIFDEFHERHLHGDLALALCLDARAALREELRLLMMSATLDGGPVAELIEAPMLTSEGRAYPVAVHYLPNEPRARLPEVMAVGLRRALAETEGDILAFLPGAGEIRRTHALLEEAPEAAGVALHMLYGDLPLEAQQKALLPDAGGRRKVVLATPIAETSLTIEGVSTVVDSGWARAPRFDPRSGLSRLETVRISAASAEQRAGRAGRLGPGSCYRLWSEGTQRGLQPQGLPEIAQADLAPLALELAAWGVEEAGALRWLDPPPAGALAQGRELLVRLGALDGRGTITPLGREMAALPMHPRLAHMVLGAPASERAAACDIAALLGERDVLRGEAGRAVDFALRLEALAAFRRGGRGAARDFGADPGACAAVERAAKQWRRRLGCDVPEGAPAAEMTGRLLALAYPDRVAQRRRNDGGGGAPRYLLSGGRGARLDEGAAADEYLVAASVDGRGEEARIRLAAPIDVATLREQFAEQIETIEVVDWDSREGAVAAQVEERFGALCLAAKPLTASDPERIAAGLLAGVRQMGIDVLPWRREARELQARVLSLRHWQPEAGWPDLSDAHLAATLETWLAPWVAGMSRRKHLERLDMVAILTAQLDYPQQQRLAAEAPTHLAVPSGSRIRLEYLPGEAPVLAVKLQELFGLAETPRVAGGRVPVTLHLLSPARRPVQVTQDLRGFWERTYPEVCKELKGRYPKHPWPDDPWNAPATAGTRRRH